MKFDINAGNCYRVYAGIHLDSVLSNLMEIKKNLINNAEVMAVVKTDAYGHGAVEIARKIEAFVVGFAVATVEEAISLINHGIKKPVLILGFIHESLYETIVLNDIRIPIYTYEAAKKLSKIAGNLQRVANIHIKIDTGMNRLGAADTDSTIEMIKDIKLLPNIDVEGIFTHFIAADEVDKSKSDNQLEHFRSLLHKLELYGVEIPIKHCSNSAATIDIPTSHFNMVRIGISLYGLYPSNEVNTEKIKLIPSLELKSHIVYLKDVEKGNGISYGSTYITTEKTSVATIPVGYGDGYPRYLSNKGYVLVRGQKAPILGRVCMDQFMVDVSHIEGAKEGDVVTLVGEDAGQRISVEDLTRMGESTFNYEFLCGLGKRIPRVYYDKEQIIAIKEYLPLLQ
ncbi:MAG: alanine racemase [Clostridiales bacterium]|nr:alanine racemase [Clostridiales bacterium]